MEVKDILSSRRLELKLTMKEVADRVGVSEGTISRWESGEIANMRRDKIMLLAQALQLSPGVIMGWEDHDSPVPPAYPNIHPVAVKSFPLFDGIAAGEPILMPDGIDAYVDADEPIRADFALKVHGDSMEPLIQDGSIVFVRSQPTVETGQIAVVAIDSDATLKRFYRSGDTITLVAENPRYPPMVFTAESGKEIRILGRAVYCQIEIT